MNYLYILGTLTFTIYGQIILKWRISSLAWTMPSGSLFTKTLAYARFLCDPFIFSGFLSAFVASIFWIMVMTKFELTEAYPFMSLAPAIVFILGIFILGETFTLGKVLGLLFIMVGIFITVNV